MTKEILKQLQTDVENAEAVDDNQAKAMVDLQDHIQRSMDDPEYQPTLIDVLRHSIVLFETDHHQLAKSIRSALEILSEGGI